jgi:hypothetical protein
MQLRISKHSQGCGKAYLTNSSSRSSHCRVEGHASFRWNAVVVLGSGLTVHIVGWTRGGTALEGGQGGRADAAAGIVVHPGPTQKEV